MQASGEKLSLKIAIELKDYYNQTVKIHEEKLYKLSKLSFKKNSFVKIKLYPNEPRVGVSEMNFTYRSNNELKFNAGI